MLEKPILEKSFYKSTAPKSRHKVKVWRSEKLPDMFSFSCVYGRAVMSKCDRYPEDAPYQFGQFSTAEEALEAGRMVIFDECPVLDPEDLIV